MTPVDELPLDAPMPEPQPKPYRKSQQSDPDAWNGLDCANRDMLRPALAALIERGGDLFDPVRIRFIQALVEKALQLRPSVASIVEKKAMQAASDYLNDYRSARKHAASLVDRVTSETPAAADEINRLFESGDFKAVKKLADQTAVYDETDPGRLAVLTREMLQPDDDKALAANPSLEDELRLLEFQVMQSVARTKTDTASDMGGSRGKASLDVLSTTRHFRQLLRKHQAQQRITRVIQERPENPGPLNAQALIIRSISTMRDLSPSYADRFVSYMDTLLWLERAGSAAEQAKKKGDRRRRS
jgi:hypothetical protein